MTLGCTECEGGWVHLADSTIEREFPQPDLPDNDPDEAARLQAEWTNNRAMARNTWYPCRECNRRAFFRWREGHWDPDHDRAACDTCDTPRHSRRRRSTPERAPAPLGAGYVDFTEPKEQEPF